jgi:glycosyltransferase involved in cell wall biosynthesis
VSPAVTIVTVNLNQRDGLARTLDSIRRQTFADREVVVVDGGSKDGSVELLRENPGGVVTDWVSEKDAGIYDAMNKGIRRAKGTYVLFLNGGDAFAADDALEKVLAAGENVEDVVYADVLIEARDGAIRRWSTPDVLDLDYFMVTTLPHQATLFRRDLFERVGLHDPSFRICADFEFLLRAIVVRGASTRHVGIPLAVQVDGGISSSPEAFARLREERKRAKETALSPVLRAHWEAYLTAKRGVLHQAIRNGFRPLARRMRSWSRRLRGKPDALV